MMLSLLALLVAQGVPAENAASQAALRCAAAAPVVGASRESAMRLTAQVAYFTMQAAAAAPSDKPFLDTVTAMGGKLGSAPTPEAAQATIAECDRRYPLARASGATAKLPTDAFRRDVMCFGTLAVLKGAADQIKADGGDGAAAVSIDAAMDPLTARMTDAALAARGLTTDVAFAKAMGDEIRASLQLGNPIAIARACGVSTL